jgi:hypothetical protein
MFAVPTAPTPEDPAAQWLRWAVIQWKYPEGLTIPGKTMAAADRMPVPDPREEETERTGA